MHDARRSDSGSIAPKACGLDGYRLQGRCVPTASRGGPTRPPPRLDRNSIQTRHLGAVPRRGLPGAHGWLLCPSTDPDRGLSKTRRALRLDGPGAGPGRVREGDPRQNPTGYRSRPRILAISLVQGSLARGGWRTCQSHRPETSDGRSGPDRPFACAERGAQGLAGRLVAACVAGAGGVAGADSASEAGCVAGADSASEAVTGHGSA